VSYLSNKSRRYNVRIKSHYFTKAPLRRPNILSILGVINTNVVMLPGFYKNKIMLLFYLLVLKHKAHYLYLVSYYVYLR
jgi:hypothetical protein